MSHGAVGTGEVDDRAALLAADATGDVFIPPGRVFLVGSDVTLTSNLRFARGGMLRPAAGVTITIAGVIQHTLHQIFDCALGGAVRLAPYNDTELNPNMFGARPDYSGDSTIAFQKLFGSQAMRIYIPWGQYDVRATVRIGAGRKHVRGQGLRSLIYFNPTADDVALFETDSDDNCIFEDFYCHHNTYARRAGVTCFKFDNPNVSAVRFTRVAIERFTKCGIHLRDAMYVNIDTCRFMGMRSLGPAPAEAIAVDGYLHSGVVRASRFGQNDRDVRISRGVAVAIEAGCSFERSGDTPDRPYPREAARIGACIDVQNTRTFSLRDCYVEAPVPGPATGFLRLANVTGFHLNAVDFGGEWGPPGSAATACQVHIVGGRGGLLTQCNFTEIRRAFIDVESHATTVRCMQCTFRSGTAFVTSREALMSRMGGAQKNRLEFDNYPS